MIDFSEIGAYVKEHPKAAMAAGVIGGGGVLFAILRKPKAQENVAEQRTVPVSPMESVPVGAPANYSNYPVINVTVPPSPRPPTEALEPARTFRTIARDGRAIKVTAGPDNICPPGYVSATQPGQPPRCTLVSDVNKKPGQRTSYVPLLGQSPYVQR